MALRGNSRALTFLPLFVCFAGLQSGCKESFDSLDPTETSGEEADESGSTTQSTGDGDGDASTGDGDGDTSTGDGDGDGDGDIENTLCAGDPIPFGFAMGTTVELGGSVIAMEAGQFMGNDALDLIAINYTNGELVYLEGNGNGLFPNRTDFWLENGTCRDFAIVDPFQNGDLHLFVHRTVLLDPDPDVTDIWIMPVDPAALDAAPFATMTTSTDGFGMEPIDLDNDGARDDLVVSGGEPQTGTGFHLDFTIGLEGTPSFASTPVMGYMPWNMAVGDLNGDDIDDIAVSMVDEGQAAIEDSVEIYLGDGQGSMSYWATLPVGNDPRDVGFGDFDGDDNLDLAVAIANLNNPQSEGDTVQIFRGDGSGNFELDDEIPVGAWPSTLEIYDINCDGEEDILLTAEADNEVNILLGSTGMSFAAPMALPVDGQLPSTIAIGDYNGDQLPDLAVGTWNDGNIAILLGNDA